jgi:hypothetical protein
MCQNISQSENQPSKGSSISRFFTYEGWSVTIKSPTIPLLYSYRASGFVFTTDGKNEAIRILSIERTNIAIISVSLSVVYR